MIEEWISSEDPMASRMRRHAMVTAVLTIAPLTLLGVALTTRSWGEGLVTALCLLLVLGVLREWNLDGYPPRSVFAVVVTAMAWVAGAALTTSPLGFVPLALVGALMLARVRRRFLWIGLFALAVASLGTAAFVLHPFTAQRAAPHLLLPFLSVLFGRVVRRATSSAVPTSDSARWNPRMSWCAPSRPCSTPRAGSRHRDRGRRAC